MFNLLSALTDIIYPECCGFCGREVLKGKWICEECASKVPLISWEGKMPPRYRNMHFDKVFFAGIYDGTSKNGVLRLKKNYAFNTAKYFCVKLADNIRKSGLSDSIDYVAFVPMSRVKKRQIGYDHAEYIAKLLSEELEKPMLKNVIHRKHSMKSQHSQKSTAKRREFANSKYSVPKKRTDLTGRTILLCDDILTSGNSLSRCAEILKTQGAKAVYAVALVCTNPPIEEL